MSEWKDILAVYAGQFHTLGLKADGSVVACGLDSSKQCSVSSWSNIVAISAGCNYSVALTVDGKVLSCGDTGTNERELSDWLLFLPEESEEAALSENRQ